MDDISLAERLERYHRALILTRQAFQRFLVMNHDQAKAKKELEAIDQLITKTLYLDPKEGKR